MAHIDREMRSGAVGLCSVEAARGEAHHYILTGDENRPFRWRVRAPTYPNLQAVGCMIEGEQLADVPICLGSYDPCFSCTERVETLDVNTSQVRNLYEGRTGRDVQAKGVELNDEALGFTTIA